MSQKVSFGALTSGVIGRNTSETAIAKRQRENREKLAEKLDKLRSGWYNVRSRNQRGSDNSGDDSGDLKMAGRKAAVKKSDFVRIYSAGCNAGKTNDEIAKELGMASQSCSSKASQVRKELKEKYNRELPYPASKVRSGRTAVEDADFLSALDGLNEVGGTDVAAE